MFIYFILLHIYSNSNKKKKKKAHKSARIAKYNVFFFLFLSLCLSYTYWNNDVLVDGTLNVNITEIRTKIFDNLLTQLSLRLSNQYIENSFCFLLFLLSI